MPRTSEIALLRLAAQRIAGPGCDSAAEAVRWMTATQAQDLPGALVSVALRTASSTRADVERAFADGHVVRTWPFRGTLHLVAAEDLGWMLELAGPRGLARAAVRRRGLGLDDDVVGRARERAVAELTATGPLRRADLLAVWAADGLAPSGQHGTHLLGHLAQTGTLCFGPLEGREQLVVLTDTWIPAPRRLEREEALGELALRYLASHGPATPADFARWTGLVAADVRAGCASARPRLERTEVDGVEYLMDPATPERLAAARRQARGVFLLPGFDELILGYADRSPTLPAAFAERIVPGANGIFRPTVVAGGQVVGTWRHAGTGARRTAEATPFTAFTPSVAAAIPRRHRALP